MVGCWFRISSRTATGDQRMVREGSEPGPGPPSPERPLCPVPISAVGVLLSAVDLTQALTHFPVNVCFQSKVQERTFQMVLGSDPEEGSGLHGPLLSSFLPLASHPPHSLYCRVMQWGIRSPGGLGEVGVAHWGHSVLFLLLSCS